MWDTARRIRKSGLLRSVKISGLDVPFARRADANLRSHVETIATCIWVRVAADSLPDLRSDTASGKRVRVKNRRRAPPFGVPSLFGQWKVISLVQGRIAFRENSVQPPTHQVVGSSVREDVKARLTNRLHGCRCDLLWRHTVPHPLP